MKSTTLCTVAAAWVSAVWAIDLAPRTPNPRVVGLEIEKRSVSNLVARDRARSARLNKRQKVVNEILDNEEALYYANVTLGTPAQSLSLHLDTGSSDLWVNVANSTFCKSEEDDCEGGTYNPTASSTSKFVSSDFNISYVDGSGALGNYVTDKLGFSGATLDNFQFGVGLTSTSQQGVLGIGYSTNEVQVQTGGGQAYANLPLALKNAGIINRNAYSLWLNDLDANTGSILFGGVNKAKYQGTLETVPVYRQYGQYVQFIIAMSSFVFNGSTVTSANLPSPVLLDSGSTLTRLPDDIVSTLYDQLGIIYDADAGVGVGYCSLANTDAYLEFGFSGINIQVPFSELFLDAGTDASGRPLTFQNGEKACIFGIGPADGIIPILGDTFLRSAYVVYDLDANQISLAQTKFNSTTDDIVEIASGTSAVPGATPAPSTVHSLAIGTATDGARIGGTTGSLTALGTNPTSAPALSTVTSSSSHAGAYQTHAPYLAGAGVGAAAMVGVGLLF